MHTYIGIIENETAAIERLGGTDAVSKVIKSSGQWTSLLIIIEWK